MQDLIEVEESIEELEEEDAGVEADFPWVLFSVNEITYGVYSAFVLSIEISSTVTSIVDTPGYMRGVTNFRGDMIELIDLRTLFGIPNRVDALLQTLQPKINAHTTWVETLRRCVETGEKFTLATDPHMCAFGKWYYNFTTSDVVLSSHLKRVEKPHSELHTRGAKVVTLLEAGKNDEALKLYEAEILPAYRHTMDLLSQTLQVYTEGTREMLVVIEVGGVVKGLIVDEIVSVEYMTKMIDMPDDNNRSKYVKTLCQRDGNHRTVQILNEELLISL